MASGGKTLQRGTQDRKDRRRSPDRGEGHRGLGLETFAHHTQDHKDRRRSPDRGEGRQGGSVRRTFAHHKRGTERDTRSPKVSRPRRRAQGAKSTGGSVRRPSPITAPRGTQGSPKVSRPRRRAPRGLGPENLRPSQEGDRRGHKIAEGLPTEAKSTGGHQGARSGDLRPSQGKA